jgi:hypothetical protein
MPSLMPWELSSTLQGKKKKSHAPVFGNMAFNENELRAAGL